MMMSQLNQPNQMSQAQSLEYWHHFHRKLILRFIASLVLIFIVIFVTTSVLAPSAPPPAPVVLPPLPSLPSLPLFPSQDSPKQRNEQESIVPENEADFIDTKKGTSAHNDVTARQSDVSQTAPLVIESSISSFLSEALPARPAQASALSTRDNSQFQQIGLSNQSQNETNGESGASGESDANETNEANGGSGEEDKALDPGSDIDETDKADDTQHTNEANETKKDERDEYEHQEANDSTTSQSNATDDTKQTDYESNHSNNSNDPNGKANENNENQHQQQKQPLSQLQIGDSICLTGYIMDRHTLAHGHRDRQFQPLMHPEQHSFHYLVDVKQCRESGYEVLIDLNELGKKLGELDELDDEVDGVDVLDGLDGLNNLDESHDGVNHPISYAGYSRGVRLDEAGNREVISLARSEGASCSALNTLNALNALDAHSSLSLGGFNGRNGHKSRNILTVPLTGSRKIADNDEDAAEQSEQAEEAEEQCMQAHGWHGRHGRRRCHQQLNFCCNTCTGPQVESVVAVGSVGAVRAVGAPTTHTTGFRATINGTITDLGDAQTPISIRTNSVQDDSVGCGDYYFIPPHIITTIDDEYDENDHFTTHRIILIHASLMIIGWGWLMPSGVLMARYLKHRPNSLWLKLHKYIQMVGITLAIIAWIPILLVGESFVGDDFGGGGVAYTHGVLGIIVMVVGILQPLIGFLRPPAPGENVVSPSRRGSNGRNGAGHGSNGRNGGNGSNGHYGGNGGTGNGNGNSYSSLAPQTYHATYSLFGTYSPYAPPSDLATVKSTAREIWDIVHKTSGYVAILLSMVTIILGTMLLPDEPEIEIPDEPTIPDESNESIVHDKPVMSLQTKFQLGYGLGALGALLILWGALLVDRKRWRRRDDSIRSKDGMEDWENGQRLLGFEDVSEWL